MANFVSNNRALIALHGINKRRKKLVFDQTKLNSLRFLLDPKTVLEAIDQALPCFWCDGS